MGEAAADVRRASGGQGGGGTSLGAPGACGPGGAALGDAAGSRWGRPPCVPVSAEGAVGVRGRVSSRSSLLEGTCLHTQVSGVTPRAARRRPPPVWTEAVVAWGRAWRAADVGCSAPMGSALGLDGGGGLGARFCSCLGPRRLGLCPASPAGWVGWFVWFPFSPHPFLPPSCSPLPAQPQSPDWSETSPLLRSRLPRRRLL